MTRAIHRLTATKANSIKLPGYYSDGGNLYFRVAEGGTRGWIFGSAWTAARDAGLGSYPTVTLAGARELAEECRQRVAAGIDPIEHRNRERAEA